MTTLAIDAENLISDCDVILRRLRRIDLKRPWSSIQPYSDNVLPEVTAWLNGLATATMRIETDEAFPDPWQPLFSWPTSQGVATAVAYVTELRKWAKCSLSETDRTSGPPDNWGDYRSGPGGSLLTTQYCKNRFAVSGKDLSMDKDAVKNRRKNPRGRKGGDYVYRYVDVVRIANGKGEPKSPPSKELAKLRDRIRYERT